MASEASTPELPNESLQELVDELVTRGQLRPERCVDLSELGELVQELELSDDAVPALEDLLEERGFNVRDDCGRAQVERVTYVNDDLADRTTDAMSLFLQEVRRHPLLTRQEEIELSKQIERGDLRAKERLVNSNLRL